MGRGLKGEGQTRRAAYYVTSLRRTHTNSVDRLNHKCHVLVSIRSKKNKKNTCNLDDIDIYILY